MTVSNLCRALQGPFVYSDPPPPPLLYVSNADVVISLLPGERHNLYVTSAMLNRCSDWFKTSLGPGGLNDIITGQEDPGNGTLRTMERYELEFSSNGTNNLVGKTSITSEDRRTAAIEEAITSDSYRSANHYLRHPLAKLSSPGLILERGTIATVNLLGLCILCGFPLEPTAITSEFNRPHDDDEVESGKLEIKTLYLFRKLLQWIHRYGVLEPARWTLAR